MKRSLIFFFLFLLLQSMGQMAVAGDKGGNGSGAPEIIEEYRLTSRCPAPNQEEIVVASEDPVSLLCESLKGDDDIKEFLSNGRNTNFPVTGPVSSTEESVYVRFYMNCCPQ